MIMKKNIINLKWKFLNKLLNLQHQENYLIIEKKINYSADLVFRQFLGLAQMVQLFITEFQKKQIKL